MVDMLVGLRKEGTHAHVKDSQPSRQVCPSGDPAPGAGAMATSLACKGRGHLSILRYTDQVPGALGFLVQEYTVCTVL